MSRGLGDVYKRQIGFCPPLVINGDELDDMFDRVEAALDEFTTTAESLR